MITAKEANELFIYQRELEDAAQMEYFDTKVKEAISLGDRCIYLYTGDVDRILDKIREAGYTIDYNGSIPTIRW